MHDYNLHEWNIIIIKTKEQSDKYIEKSYGKSKKGLHTSKCVAFDANLCWD